MMAWFGILMTVPVTDEDKKSSEHQEKRAAAIEKVLEILSPIEAALDGGDATPPSFLSHASGPGLEDFRFTPLCAAFREMDAKMSPDMFEALAQKRPRFVAWLERMTARPSFQQVEGRPVELRQAASLAHFADHYVQALKAHPAVVAAKATMESVAPGADAPPPPETRMKALRAELDKPPAMARGVLHL